MQTFDTPEPISVTVELGVGDLRVVAGDRADTVVEVRPSDPAKKGDVTAAEQTRVEYSGGRLLIKAPKGWRHYTPRGGGDSVNVQVELPKKLSDRHYQLTLTGPWPAYTFVTDPESK